MGVLAGFATGQEAMNKVAALVFAALDELEARLSAAAIFSKSASGKPTGCSLHARSFRRGLSRALQMQCARIVDYRISTAICGSYTSSRHRGGR